MRATTLLAGISIVLCLICRATRANEDTSDYAVVVSKATRQDPGWAKVVDALVDKHGAGVIEFDKSVDEALPVLQERFPRYACFVATPNEAGREFVADVHRLTRRLDDDPYTDLLWGILTGYDAPSALVIARHSQPLTIERVAGGTEVALEMCRQGVWYCELVPGKIVRKRPGEKPHQEQGPADSTKALVDVLNNYKPELWVTSGHATERDWQIGFRYRNGYFVSADGHLEGIDTHKNRYPIDSPNPKVFLPVGNCLMGHVDGTDAMALAYMRSAGVQQMIGYTVPTWFGYAGWGCLDYFVEQPGRFTFAEAFFANGQALLHKLQTKYPKLADQQPEPGRAVSNSEGGGLLHDRDVLAFYGDPAWVARLAPAEAAWDQELTRAGDVWTLTITPNKGEQTFRPINTNGSQRGGRPIFQMLPVRIRQAEVIAGAQYQPVVTDNFVLVPLPDKPPANGPMKIVFRGQAM